MAFIGVRIVAHVGQKALLARVADSATSLASRSIRSPRLRSEISLMKVMKSPGSSPWRHDEDVEADRNQSAIAVLQLGSTTGPFLQAHRGLPRRRASAQAWIDIPTLKASISSTE
jgi:hypothetical protein